MDSRLQDVAWTFLSGVNHYHPYWEETARAPLKTQLATTKSHRPGV